MYVENMSYNKSMHWVKVLSALIVLFTLIQSKALECPIEQKSEQQLLALSLQCFKQVYNPQKHDGHKLTRLLDQKLIIYKKILQNISMRNIKHTETNPVIKWAQTKDKIYLNFKLSHRQDSPPCSDVSYAHFNITNVKNYSSDATVNIFESESNVTEITFQGECFFTNQKFLFQLNLTFNSTFNELTIEREGFGSYTIIGRKADEGIWIDPFHDVTKAAIWGELREKYQNQMDQYFQMRERRKEENQQKKTKKRKRKNAGKNEL